MAINVGRIKSRGLTSSWKQRRFLNEVRARDLNFYCYNRNLVEGAKRFASAAEKFREIYFSTPFGGWMRSVGPFKEKSGFRENVDYFRIQKVGWSS